MPRIGDNLEFETHRIGGGNFNFKGARIEHLGATEYTLVTIAVDVTGSVGGFQDKLREMLVNSVEACKKSPRSDNVLIRVILFSSTRQNGVEEVHGFMSLADIDTSLYPQLRPGGGTPLYDACYSAFGAMNDYARMLVAQDYGVNGIAFVITDGGNNDSSVGVSEVRRQMEDAVSQEVLESMVSVLIGINAQQYLTILATFQNEAKITQFIDAGDATPRKLAKLAEFVSRSVSSTSQALGTGGPSQSISATI